MNLDLSVDLDITFQGNVILDENGIRQADQLSVFQYRKDSMMLVLRTCTVVL